MKRALAMGALALVAVVVLSAIALRFALSPERLRTEVVRRTGAATGLDVSLEAASLSYWPVGISLAGLSVRGPQGPFLDMESGLARLDAGALLRRRVEVERLVLSEPRIVLARDSTGISLPGKLAGPGGAAGSPRPAAGPRMSGGVQSFSIENGTVVVAAGEATEDLVLRGIEIQGSLDVDAAGELRSEGTVALQGLAVPGLMEWRDTLERLSPRVDYRLRYRERDGTLAVEALRVRVDPLDITVSGQISGLPDAPHVALALEPTSVDLSELSGLLPPGTLPEGLSTEGPARLGARLEGPLGDPRAAPELTWTFRVDGARVRSDDGSDVLRDVRGALHGTASRLEVDSLAAVIPPEGSLVLAGSVSGLDGEPAYDLVASLDTDLSGAASTGLLPPDLEISGRVLAQVTASGALDGTLPSLEGTVSLTGGAARGGTLPVPADGWTLAGRLSGAELVLDRLQGRIGRSDFDLRGTVRGIPATPAVDLTGRSRLVDLVELAPPERRTAAAASGTSGAKPVPPPLVPTFPPFPTRITLAIDSLLTEGARLAGVSMEAEGSGEKGRAVLRVRTGDWSGVVLEEFDTTLELQGQTAHGNFRAPSARSFHVPLTDVRGRIDLGEDRVLRLSEMTASAFGGAVQGVAVVDLADPDRPAFDIRTEARGVDANRVVSTMTPARDVLTGTLDLTSSFVGQGATPEEITRALTGSGNVTARNGSLARTATTAAIWKTLGMSERDSMPFRDLITAFSIRDGRLLTDQLTLEGGNAVWKAGGSVSFTGELQYDVQVELNDELSALYRKRAGELAGLIGGSGERLVLDLQVRGTTKDPRVTLDRSKLAERFKDNVGDRFKKLLGK